MGTVTLTHDVTNETVGDPSQDGDIMDNEMHDVSPTTNKGTVSAILIGKTNCSGKDCELHRALHYYDMAQVVPKDAIITAAEWWIYIEGYAIDMGIDGIAEFKAERLRRNGQAPSGPGSTIWVESEATHIKFKAGDSSTDWATAGADSTVSDRDTGVSNVLTGLDPGDSGVADAAITVTDTTLKDTRKTWSDDQWNGLTVQCNNKTMLITDTYQDGSDWVVEGTGWSGGGNPGNGNHYVILDIGWWNPDLLRIVLDAQVNHNGKVHFRVARLDSVIKSAQIQYSSKEAINAARRPHLRVTYEMGVPTDSGANTDETFVTGDTTLTVTDSSPFAVGDFLLLTATELVKVTAITDGVTIEVTRGEGSTVEISHPSGFGIYLWDFATFQANVY